MTVTEQSVGLVRAVVHRSAGREVADRLEVRVGSNDDVVIAMLNGDLTAATVGVLADMVDGLAESGQVHVMLDCRQLYTVDVEGLAGLHAARAYLDQVGGLLTMTGVRPQVRAMLVRDGSAAKFGVSVMP